MPPIRSRTVTKAVRIPIHAESILRSDAIAKRTSAGGLMSSILTRYCEWDRFAEKYGFVSLTTIVFRCFLDDASEETIRKAAKINGERFKEFIMFCFKKVNLQTFLATWELLCRHTGLAEYDLHIDGANYILSLQHDFGRKWSIYLHELLQLAVHDLKLKGTIESGQASVTINLIRGS